MLNDLEYRRKNQQCCFHCHFRASCPWLHPQSRNCCGIGHTTQNCPQMQPFHGQRTRTQPGYGVSCCTEYTISAANYTCSCKSQFFKLKRVALMKGWVEGHPETFSLVSPLSLFISSSQQPVVKCAIGWVDVHALIDTGSMKSFISSEVVEKLPPRQVFVQDSPLCITNTCLLLVQHNLGCHFLAARPLLIIVTFLSFPTSLIF